MSMRERNCFDESYIPTEKATIAALLPVTKAALLTHFFHLSIDLQEMTLSLCLYLSSAVPPPLPLQTVYRLHLRFHYTALFSIAELKIASRCLPSFGFITEAARECQQAAPSDPLLWWLLDCHVTEAC